MLKALIKKQFMEIFRTYYINKKTGKAVSKGNIAGKFVAFTILMLFVAGCFYGLAFTLKDLLDVGLDWLYFALMGVMAIAMGTFGSVFNTYSILYKSGDNDLLISMPIPVKTILLSRIIGVAGLAMLYSGCVWLPACVFYWVYGSVTVSAVITDILLLFFISLFVTVLTCILGWVVAIVSGKLKNKSIVTVLISLLLIGIYYVVCFKMQDFIMGIVNNSELVGNRIRIWGNLLYQIGNAATGNWIAMIAFTVISVLLMLVTFCAMNRTFIKLATAKSTVKKTEFKQVSMEQKDIRKALFQRELSHFTSSPTYMLNCGLGLVFMPIIPIIILVKYDAFNVMLTEILTEMPVIESFLPVMGVCVMCLMASMNVISTPSVSLEGKTLWVLQSMPVQASDILKTKVNLHVLLNAFPTVISTIAFIYILTKDIYVSVLGTVLVLIFVWFSGTVGLIIGLKRPNFTWTSETTPIKQSMNVLIMMLGGWLIAVIIPGFYYLLIDKISSAAYMIILICVLGMVTEYLSHWLKTKGSEMFMKL